MIRFLPVKHTLDNNSGKAATSEHHVAKRILAGLLSATFVLGASAANVAPTVEMTAPAANTSFVAPATMTLSANAADSDGSIASVAFYRGTTLISTVTSAPYNLVWPNVAAGSYSVTSRATDNLGAVTESAPLTVTVNANVLPTISLTGPAANASFIAPVTVPLTVATADSDGAVVRVAYYRDGTAFTTTTTAPYSINWYHGGPGTYSLTARATDDKGGVAISAPVTVTVKANVLPSVTMSGPGPDASFVGPANIVVSAVASDMDGIIKRVTFYRDSTPISYSDIAPYAVTWSNAPSGTYALTARALDDKGGVTISQPMTLVVKQNELPSVAITSPSDSASYAAPGVIALKTSASDVDGTIVKVAYFNGATQIGQATVAPYAVTWGGVAIGSYSITARAYDDKGGIATSAPVAIAVNANAAPSVSMAGPASGSTYVWPAAISLSANAADSDGSIAKVDFYQGGVRIGGDTSAPYAFVWSGAYAGTYAITVKATDDKGLVGTSAPISVSIVANTAPTVSITSPANNASFYGPGSLTLSANAADSDGAVSKVVFLHGATVIGTATSAPYTVTWPNVAVGSYSIVAKAYDDKNVAAASTAVAFKMIAAPAPLIQISVAAGNGLVAPAVLTFGASAVPAPGDTISKVEYLIDGAVAGSSTTAPYEVSVPNVAAGSYSVVARATGGFGGTATSAPVTVVVTENAAPVVTLASDKATAVAPAAIVLMATASDSDGTIAKVEFYNGEALLASVTQSPYAYTWSDVAAGAYVLTARATDNLGRTTTSAPQTVTITGAVTPGAANLYFIYTDQINTAREITNAAGTKVWEADPEPFGANLPNENPAGQGSFTYNLRFPGQYFDKETGLHYNYYRDYDPQTGRYVQSDPIGLEGGIINTYGYVGGNPLSIRRSGRSICL